MTTEHGDRPEVQLVGDGISGEWVMWRWSDGPGPRVARIQGWQKARDELAAALPPSNPLHRRQLRFDRALGIGSHERRMSAELGALLLPAALRREIIERAGTSGRLVQFRVAPSPSAARIPWGLLFLDEETRLLDVADVSWIAPLTPRDVAGEPTPTAAQDGDLPPLFVIDPVLCDGGQIMSQAAHLGWRERLAGFGVANVHVHEPVTPDVLNRWLEVPRSHLVLVGHCIAGRGRGQTSFRLSDARMLTPSDMVQGELQAVRGHRARAWPMPELAAIIACASGVDLLDHEPFGLPTAMLVNGARTVIATLWPIPTDDGAERNHAGPLFTQLTHATVEALASPDPVVALNDWQRSRLAAWRSDPGPNTAPLSWASAAVIHAPDRAPG